MELLFVLSVRDTSTRPTRVDDVMAHNQAHRGAGRIWMAHHASDACMKQVVGRRTRRGGRRGRTCNVVVLGQANPTTTAGPKKLPTVDGKWPVVGHALKIRDMQSEESKSGSGLVEFFRDGAEKCGDVFGFQLPQLECCFVNEPSLVAEFTQEKGKVYEERFVAPALAFAYTETDVRYNGFRRTSQEEKDDVAGIVFSRGERWKQVRGVASQTLQQKRVQDRLQDVVCEKANLLATRWRQAGDMVEKGVSVDTEMQRYTIDVIGEVALSHDFKQLKEAYESSKATRSEFAANAEEAMMSINTMIVKDPLRLWKYFDTKDKTKYLDCAMWMAQFEDDLIKDRQKELQYATSVPDDFLGILLQTRNADGEPMSMRDIRWAVHDMFIAGNDTTASTLAAALALLAVDKRVQEKVREECERILQGKEITPDMLSQLQYVEAVVREALRLYPAAHVFGRRCTKGPDVLGGYLIEEDTIVFASPCVMHRTEKYWPEPSRFLPERFMPGGCWAGVGGTTPRLAWMPFGNGARSCIGGMLALAEAKAAIATLVQEFELETLPAGHGKTGIREDGSLVISYDITMSFVDGLRLKARPLHGVRRHQTS